MATAAPHVKLLRQLASAKDDYLSGAFDISWDGAKGTLYLVFGRPSHAVFETGQEQIEGEAAIDALLAALPRTFAVSDWRRAMSPQETLSITIDELAGPFVRLAGSYADDPVSDESPEWWSAGDDSPDLAFGLADFPLLPGGRPLWTEASPEEVRLADRLAGLPPSILILTGAKLRAAAVVSGGDLIDAVWIDADDQARGESAGMAILGATKGSLAGYALDDPRVAEALTMLWRIPLAVSGVDLSWLDPASMLAAFRADGLDRVLVIDAPVRGIALFSRGGLVAVYSETQRSAVASPERLRSLLSQARGRLTVMERKPRPLPAEAPQPQSAHEFFAIAPAETPADAGVDTASVDAEPGPPAETGAAEASAAEALPPPQPPEAAQAMPRQKRSRWGFGRSRRSRSDSTAEESARAAAEAAASADTDSSSFSGWSVRQPNSEAQQASQRAREADESPYAAAPAEPPPIDEGAGPGWSVVSPDDPPRSATTDPGIESWTSVTWLDDAVDAAHADEPAGASPTTEDEATPDLLLNEDEPEPSAPAETEPVAAMATEEPSVEDEHEAAAEAEPELELELEPEPVPAPEPAAAALEADGDHGAQWPAPAARPPGPWSWPLAEADEPEPVATPEEAVLAQARDDDESTGFFRRDEPVGSQFVDFDEVRDELIQIGVVWLGEENARQVTALLTSTRSTIDDFVATIDTIRGLQVDGQDPASIQAMAREMHQQAAERLCGA